MSVPVQTRPSRPVAGAGFLLAALAGTAAAVLPLRPVVWKLADQTLCLADLPGFREAACPGLHPGGALRWLSSLLMTTGLVDAVWWIPYLVLPAALAVLSWRRILPGRVGPALAPFLLTAAPLAHVGSSVWNLPDFAFPMTNLLGFGLVLALYAVLRPFARRGGWRLTAAMIPCMLGFVPFGLYAPYAGALALLKGVTAGEEGVRIRFVRRILPVLAGFALLAATPASAAVFVYDDLAVGLAVGYSQSVLNGALLSPFGMWPVLAFALLVDTGAPRTGLRTRLLTGAVLCGLVCLGLPKDDLRTQLRMERLISEDRLEEALEAGEANARPLRMEFAYRVFALWRTGRLEDGLFAKPFSSNHRTTAAQELKMDGQDLLFRYGLLLPARYAAMESVAARGWRPGVLRLLGDAAFIMGERDLAERDWRQLARCPFRGGFAANRLRALAEGRGLADPAFADLVPVAEADGAWRELVRTGGRPPFFDLSRDNVETFVYTRLLALKGAPPSREFARLTLAAYLLEKDAKALLDSRSAMDALCPSGPWPRVWQQGALAALSALPEDTRAKVVATLRPGVFTEDEVARFDRFVEDVAGGRATPAGLMDRYGDTYYHYDAFVR